VASIASTRLTRSIVTPSGRLENRRVGAAASSITNTPSVVGAADQAAERLADAGAGHGVVIALAAEAQAAGLVQHVRTRPGHAVEDQQAQGPARHVHAVADGVGAQQAGVLLGPEDVDQRPGLQRIDVLGVEGQPWSARGAAMRSCTAFRRRMAVNRPSPPPPAARNSSRMAAETWRGSSLFTSVTTKALALLA
jgi:hypothetical protein